MKAEGGRCRRIGSKMVEVERKMLGAVADVWRVRASMQSSTRHLDLTFTLLSREFATREFTHPLR